MPIGAAAIIGGAGLLGSLISGGAASSAAQAQAAAAKQAIAEQQREWNTINSQLQPFLQTGTSALGALAGQAGVGGDGSFNPNASLVQQPNAGPVFNIGGAPQYSPLTAASFQQSPGYQWQLGQGIDAIQNSAAGKTGAVSGNMLRSLQTYGTGLANQDWWNAYNANMQNYNLLNNQYWNQYGANRNQQGDVFSRLANLTGVGQSAAANLGSFGQNAANQIGSNIIGAGNAQAAGQVGTANAITGGVNSLSNALVSPIGNNGQSALQYILGQGGSGSNTDLTGIFAGGTPTTIQF